MQRSRPSGWLVVFAAFCLLGGFFYLFSLVEWAFIPAGEWEKLAQLAPLRVQGTGFDLNQAWTTFGPICSAAG